MLSLSIILGPNRQAGHLKKEKSDKLHKQHLSLGKAFLTLSSLDLCLGLGTGKQGFQIFETIQQLRTRALREGWETA